MVKRGCGKEGKREWSGTKKDWWRGLGQRRHGGLVSAGTKKAWRSGLLQWQGRMAVGERKRGREDDMVEGTGRHGYVAIKKA